MSNTNVIEFSSPITSVITLAERFKQARAEAGLSQQELANLAGVSQGTIANIELGTRKKPRELLSLARALRKDPEWLETGKMRAVQSVNGITKSNGFTADPWPFISVSQEEWEALNPRVKAMLEQQIRALLPNALRHQNAA